ncbi:MAG TPA: UDP-N-acetylmuramate dehydrogenase [Mycobacteriales bacterium]|nr:UDP-N-acetylmuramate dehydrogenase [Mycobacteriales bacterium]
MQVRTGVPLAGLTTLRLGGPARSLVEAASAQELVAAVRDADAAGEPLLLLGGGSNLVVSDDGWPGRVVLIRSRGIAVEAAGDVRTLTVEAGEPWDGLVARTVAEGWAGLEALSGIPGLTGATPVQNVGAYGQEVADTITRVDVWDRQEGAVLGFDPDHLRFGYRDSLLKHTDRYVVLRVVFALRASDKSGPLRYAELARRVGAGDVGAPLTDVRAAVLELRRGKGMVLDDADPDTWSAGSFFTNPIVSPAELAEFEARVAGPYPSWPAAEGTKLSAAWLIEHAGFTKGYGRGPVRISGKHTLALTHRGGGTAADLVALAAEVRDGVAARFGVRLRPEPRVVGLDL